MKTKTFKRLLISYLSFITIFTIIFNFYSLVYNNSNHTGINFKIYSLLFIIISIIINLYNLLYFRKKKLSTPYIILIITIFVFINVLFFEKYNIMLTYEKWIEKGMPEKKLSIMKSK